MKVILGINANHADSSACIIINDKLEVAIEEERLTRKKHYSGFHHLTLIMVPLSLISFSGTF